MVHISNVNPMLEGGLRYRIVIEVNGVYCPNCTCFQPTDTNWTASARNSGLDEND